MEYVSELQGLDAGGRAAGCEECGKYSTRAIVLANFPSDLKDLIYVFLRCEIVSGNEGGRVGGGRREEGWEGGKEWKGSGEYECTREEV